MMTTTLIDQQRTLPDLTVLPERRLDRVKPLNPSLVEQLRLFRETEAVSVDKIGRLIGSNGTAVSRALNGKFEGDPAAFEALLENFFRNEPLRRKARETLFANGFSANVTAFLEAVRRTNDIGLATSPAGKGKTCGAILYASENPSAILLELARWNAGSRGLARQIFRALEGRTRENERGMTLSEIVVARMGGSNRLLILDNAHRLTASGRQWVFDFHDQTGCPVALIGNDDILSEIRRNDQQFSRIGLEHKIGSGKDGTKVAEEMVARHWPEAEGQLGSLPRQVLKGKGHLRALKKQLQLARDLHRAEPGATAEAIFRMAHTQLIRDYALENL